MPEAWPSFKIVLSFYLIYALQVLHPKAKGTRLKLISRNVKSLLVITCCFFFLEIFTSIHVLPMIMIGILILVVFFLFMTTLLQRIIPAKLWSFLFYTDILVMLPHLFEDDAFGNLYIRLSKWNKN